MKKIWTAVLCLISILGVQHLSAAGPEKETWKETKAKLRAEGWKQVSERVFERQRTETQVEHLAYGREGLVWTISELKGRLKSLQEEYQSHPSEDLAKVIDSLTIRIADAREELLGTADGIASLSEASTIGCSRCYSATVDAYPLTGSQGVGAVADAKFTSDCGNSGDTYAYAYARATLNGTTTTKTQEDPRSGSNATSHAAATMNGSVDCYSEAYAATQSTALNIFYSTTETNFSCPAPVQPLSVSISGSTYEYFAGTACRSRTWTATVSGGSSPYTYKWYSGSTVVGTASTYTRSICRTHPSFQLKVVVTDSTGATVQDLHDVTVEAEPMCGDQFC
ncbi:MAG TPA: SprB repeat-containing protein [Thermoanaerobaculia bacterium]